jgi:hypothetical protein
MTDSATTPHDPYVHLRAYAATQKQATVERLQEAIAHLESAGRPVNIWTIKEASGLDYMTYYRNPEALALFRMHSTHLRKERDQKQAKRYPVPRKCANQDDHLLQENAKVRDPLLDYKRPRLVALLRQAQRERDAVRQQAQDDQTILTRRYQALLQDHMQCAIKIARLESELAEFNAFLDRFRSSLRQEEHEPNL